MFAEKLLRTKPLNGKYMSKLIDSSNISSLCQFQVLSDTAQQSCSTIPQPVMDLLQQYNSVFHEPIELPPIRAIDHQIELQPRSKPVHVRPYKYPHFQNAEIERLVNEMLQNGIIRDSKSSFSSPVLLVKKKDG